MPARPDDDLDDDLGPESTGRPGLPVDFGRMWLSIKKDWKIIPLALLVWTALGLAIAFGVVKYTYKSSGVLVWEPKSNGMPDQRVLATQAASVKMPVTLAKVKQRLKLPYPIQTLEKQIEVWFDMKTHLVTVEANGPSAEEARLLTRTVIDVFMENQTEIARARANDSAQALQKDLEAARREQVAARKAYDAFRLEHGIADIDTETRLAAEAAASLREEQERAQVDARALSARAAELNTLVKRQSRTSVQSISASNSDAIELSRLQTELAAKQARFSPEHPEVRKLQAQVAVFQARASKKNVTENVVMGANPEFQSLTSTLSTTQADQQAASKRQEDLEKFKQGAEQRLAALSAVEGKVRELAANVAGVDKRISDLEADHSTALDAVRTPVIEFRVLTPASLPEWPERSKRRLIVMIMPVAGLLLAVFILIFRPLRDGRVYTAREAAFWANMPVVSSSAWPRDRDSFFPLIDELGDDGGPSRGFTLVLGASPRERVLAEELAYWLGGSSLGNDGKAEVRTAADASGNGAVPSNGRVPPQHGEAVPVSVSVSPGAATHVSGSPGVVAGSGQALALVHPGGAAAAPSSLVPYQRSGSSMQAARHGAHAWVGDAEGPALRRAARAADRVLVVLSSGTELFTSLASLRTKLGRDHGIAILLLAVRPELLKLPDRVGDVERFWRAPRA